MKNNLLVNKNTYIRKEVFKERNFWQAFVKSNEFFQSDCMLTRLHFVVMSRK